MTDELSGLKQEVAELWARYRNKPLQLVHHDEGHQALAELTRGLEKQRSALSEKRAALRRQVEAHQRWAARRSPAVRLFGGLVGGLLAAVVVNAGLSWLIEGSLDLGVGQGALVLTTSFLVGGLSASRVVAGGST